jgi:hypothetical protein
MHVCAGLVVMPAVFVWIGVATYSARKARAEHSRVGPLTWSSAQDPNSYDEIGRRLLRRTKLMFWGFIPFSILMILVAHLLCPGDF